MDKYYYFASQLPLLSFGVRSNLTPGWFIVEARKWVDEKNLCFLAQTMMHKTFEDAGVPVVLKKYKKFEEELRNHLYCLRYAKKENSKYKLPEFLGSAVLKSNPLDAEKNIMRIKWNFLENLEKEHYFDINFLILYFLKLQILERLFTFDKREGQETFQKVCEVVYV